MEFRRINNLPPYVFSIINNLKIEARRAGVDVIDLGFGNPDIPSPEIAVTKLSEAAHIARNHRYSLSRGLPKLREAVAALYLRNWNVTLDPETEITNTIGSKEGFSHLMWVLLQSGDAAIVPSPSYPIHIYGPLFAGADLRQVPMRTDADFFEHLEVAWNVGWPKPRVLIISFPHNPTGACVDAAFMQRVVDFCREHEMIAVHDFAYADIGFDGYRPPSILQAEGAKECAVELYSMTKSFSMAGWRIAYMSGNAEVVAAPQSQELPRLRHVPADPDRRDRHHERGGDYPGGVLDLSEPPGRVVRGARAHRLGHTEPKGTMFVWAPMPEPYREMGSVEFASKLVTECEVATSPGDGFGFGGEGYVRFALIENEQRIAQGIRNLRKGLTKLA
jgi:alanine-synthesizing transaminase